MSKTTSVIKGAAFQMEALAEHLVRKYQADSYEAQKLSFEEEGRQGLIVQVRNVKESSFLDRMKAAVGCSVCATLKLMSCENGDLEFEVGGGKWLDKGALLVVSLFVLWPLAVTSGLGAYKQKKLLSGLQEEVLGFFAKYEKN